VPGLRGTALHFTAPASVGANALVAGFPGGGRLKPVPATIGPIVRAEITHANAKDDSTLHVYPVRGQVGPGNSGGPLMAPNGGVYGIIFARSPAPQSGWAITSSDVSRDATAGSRLTISVPAPAQPSC
jgi:S1-C subfamily serine protease